MEFKDYYDVLLSTEKGIDEKTAAVESIETEINNRETDFTTQITEKDNQITELNQTIADLNNQINTLNTNYADLETKYKDRFLGNDGDTSNKLNDTADYLSAIDKLFM